MAPTRREFLRTSAHAGVGFLAAISPTLGLFGCQRLEDALATYAVGPEDGPFAAPPDGSIDEVGHLLGVGGHGEAG